MPHITSSLDRYQALLEKLGTPHWRLRDQLWSVYSNMITPVAPLINAPQLNAEDVQQVFRRLPGLLIRWTDGLDTRLESPWFSIICDHFLHTSEMKAKRRSMIRRGNRNCRVQRVDAGYVAQHGYEVYRESLSRYRSPKINPIPGKDFEKIINIYQDFTDIVEFWGVWSQSRLTAYAKVYLYDKVEANYSIIRFSSQGLASYSSYALLYAMNEEYLLKRGFRYVNDGFKSLLHDTEFQAHLIRNFNFRHGYMNLMIAYRWYVNTLLHASYPLRNPLRLIDRRLAALYEQERIRRDCLTK